MKKGKMKCDQQKLDFLSQIIW